MIADIHVLGNTQTYSHKMTDIPYPTREIGNTSGYFSLNTSLLRGVYKDIQSTCFDLIISHHQVLIQEHKPYLLELHVCEGGALGLFVLIN